MVFSSSVFLCIFLPVVWILHTVLPWNAAKNALLVVASLLFYAYGEPVYVLLMLASAAINYFCALMVAKWHRRILLALAVVANIGILAFFKYSGFFVENVNALFRLAIPVPGVALPVGISFFTFQALSYVIDVYRGKTEVQRNFFKVLLYISLFPQLIAGPIVRYPQVAAEIDDRSVTPRDAAFGFRRFIFGLAKKVLIANTMGEAADVIFNAGAANIDGLAAWVGAIAYLMQIYYDFSGYSDMAIGLGQMLGFKFPENFLHPYGARNIQEFWRKWHVSLSSWFKDYVYIPLGGNRKGKVRTVINRIIVFLLTGFWHGANWTFVLWGAFHGFLLLLEEAIPAIKKLPAVLGHIYTIFMVTLSFVIFRAESVGEAFAFIGKMFTGFSAVTYSSIAFRVLNPWFLVMLIAAVIFCAPLAPLTDRIRGLKDKENLSRAEKVVQIACFAVSIVLLVWCLLRLSTGAYNPFIYFRF